MRPALAAAALLLCGFAAQETEPSAFEARGRVVCLLEEMKDAWKLEVKPLHEHLWGFRVEGKPPRHYTILRTRMAEGLFVDEKLRARELRLGGRAFPSGTLLEVSRIQWFKDGKAFDVFYWCSVCSIKQWDPGACACCQAEVELRDAPAKE